MLPPAPAYVLDGTDEPAARTRVAALLASPAGGGASAVSVEALVPLVREAAEVQAWADSLRASLARVRAISPPSAGA